MKICYFLFHFLILMLETISCHCQDLIIKVKYFGNTDSSISIKKNISIIINQITDSYKIQEFNTLKKDKHNSIYIVSLPVMLKTSQIDFIENSILKDKSKEIKQIKMIKNNKINEETFFSNEIEENILHRNLEGNLRGNITTEIETPFIEAEYFYKKNISGHNISIAIFDSGINNVFAGCTNLNEVINFTDEENEDFNGHGTFISSIICKIAKNSNIYFFKVFNKNRKTFSSWLYQAIEKAISMDIKIFNFSFGGINFDDYLITSAIKKAVAKGIIIICAAGNDGPTYGTINYPGNLPYLLTVGALQNNQLNISEISSRGPAIFNNVNSYIDKPELWAIGENIEGINHRGEKIKKRGTSMACSIVSGYLGLIFSSKLLEEYHSISSIKYFISKSSLHLKYSNSNEMTSKIFDSVALFRYLRNKDEIHEKYVFLKDIFDFTFSPLNSENYHLVGKKYYRQYFYSTIQPIYLTMQIMSLNQKNPFFIINKNFTIESRIKKDDKLVDSPDCMNVKLMYIKIEYLGNKKLFGHNDSVIVKTHLEIIEFRIGINDSTDCKFLRERFEIKINKEVLEIVDSNMKIYKPFNVSFSMILDLIPIPNRFHRILFDVYHNLYYPFDGLIPKDNLYDNNFTYDWSSESLNSNYFQLFRSLKDEEYFVEELREPLDCVDLKLYSVLILPDLEKNFTDSEIIKLRYQFENEYISIFIIGDWSNSLIENSLFSQIRWKKNKDDRMNIGGANIYTFNKFLSHYGIELGRDSITKDLYINSKKIIIRSGCSISKFPSNNIIYGGIMDNDEYNLSRNNQRLVKRSVLGLMNKLSGKEHSGRLAVFTDSYCIDDFQMKHDVIDNNCFWLVKSVIKFLMLGVYDQNLNFQSYTKLNLDYDNKIDYESIKILPSDKNNSEVSTNKSIQNYSNYNFSKDLSNNEYLNKNEFQCFNYNFSDFYNTEQYNFYNNSEYRTSQTTSQIPNLYNILPNFEFDVPNNLIDSFEDIVYVLCVILFFFVVFYFRMKRRNDIVEIRRRERSTYTRLTPIRERISNNNINL